MASPPNPDWSEDVKHFLAVFAVLSLCGGCTVVNLRRHAVDQSMSLVDLRYQQVMDNLAILAHNSGELPSFALTGSGIVTVTNSYGFDVKTGWNAFGFTSQSLNAIGKHNPSPQWTIDPVADATLLQGMRAACLWVICDGLPEDTQTADLLGGASEAEIYDTLECTTDNQGNLAVQRHIPASAPRPHFDVLKALIQLPDGWLQCGSARSIPSTACYSSKYRGTCVWVTREGMEGLSEFTLILMDIATRNPATLNASPATVTVDTKFCSKDDQNSLVKTWRIAKVIDKNTPSEDASYAALDAVGTAYFLPSCEDTCKYTEQPLKYKPQGTTTRGKDTIRYDSRDSKNSGSYIPLPDLPTAHGYRRN